MAETAALIFTSGFVDRMPESLADSGRSLSIHIWNLAMHVNGGEPGAYGTALVLVALLAAAMFVPVKFIHPVRTDRWRALSLPMALAWTVFAAFAAWADFEPGAGVFWGLMVTSIYLLFAGALQQVLHGPDG